MINNQISDIERKILAVLQGGFPRSPTPYKDTAKRVGIETEQLLNILKDWKREGKLRRIGSIVDHSKPENVERVGTKLAGFKEVTHAYERKISENWPFNIYTMVHGADIQEVEQIVESKSQTAGVSDYRILTTKKELKKVPPTYVTGPSAKNTKEEG